ncbi:thioredoxin reductase (NADPH) [Streptomyces sp. V4I8]|uniref:NAD(P)/FAD-dependent oxidoreductase n=1 Tax=Streptomyces sp. V4I8 TaxID=3156469 RepID=UPI003519D683
MPVNRPVILLVHSDAWKAAELRGEFDVWCEGDLDVLTVPSAQFARDVIGKQKEDVDDWLAIVLVEEDLPDTKGEDFLRELHDDYKGTALALLSDRQETGSSPAAIISPSSSNFGCMLDRLFLNWHPPISQVMVSGARNTVQADDLAHFLWLNRVSSKWRNTSGPLTVTVNATKAEIREPTWVQLYEGLGIVPELKHDPYSHDYDLVIIGSGPAGLNAAINAGVNVGLSTLVIERRAPGGNAATSINAIENYLGFPRGVAGRSLPKLAFRQIQEQNLDVDFRLSAEAIAVMRGDGDRYVIKVRDRGDDHSVSAGMVLLACGLNPKKLKLTKPAIPVRGVYYSALPCDQYRERNKRVAIVGGGDSAGQAALLFSRGRASQVLLIAKEGLGDMGRPLRKEVEADERITPFPQHEVAAFTGDEQLTGVRVKKAGDRLRDAADYEVSSAYVLIGGDPDTDWLNDGDVEIDRTRRGFIRTDAYLKPRRGRGSFETSEPGVFAAGDVRVNSNRRVSQAAGQGSAAVASMQRYAAENRHILVYDDSAARIQLDISSLTDDE